jgi:tetratricopeptide (TPR) repeat protein
MAGMRSEYPDQTILELAIAYANRGRKEDAVVLLGDASGRLRNPLLGAWRAYLEKDPAAVAKPVDVTFVFPYRRETLAVLEWATAQSTQWTWKYLLALNLWALDRPAEAESLLRSLGDAADSGAFYITRAALTAKSGGDPERDLLHAESLAGSDRHLRIPLIRHYQTRGRWADALAVTARMRERSSPDFNIDLLQVRSLVHLNRAAEALAILDKTHVLPSEHAGESHHLYVQAHTLAALSALEAGRVDEADRHLKAALEWPEHLGQGRPYDPEERLVRFLLGRVEERRGRTDEARRSFEAVVAATPSGRGAARPIDLLAIAALRALGRTNDAVSRAAALPRATPADVREVAAALARGDVPVDTARRVNDLDRQLVMRALSLSEQRTNSPRRRDF